jgi:hypothetical protein
MLSGSVKQPSKVLSQFSDGSTFANGGFMSLGSLLKSARAGVSPEMLKGMLEGFGLKLDMQPISIGADGSKALKAFVSQCGWRGASLQQITGTMKDGGRLTALIVLVPEK